MEDLINEITNLSQKWYSLVGKDHHKDRDCHWYIETKWSYGQKPKYEVQHFGYIIHPDVEIECHSYEQALRVLKKKLETSILLEEQERVEYDQQN
jgi:hypothetical protein